MVIFWRFNWGKSYNRKNIWEFDIRQWLTLDRSKQSVKAFFSEIRKCFLKKRRHTIWTLRVHPTRSKWMFRKALALKKSVFLPALKKPLFMDHGLKLKWCWHFVVMFLVTYPHETCWNLVKLQYCWLSPPFYTTNSPNVCFLASGRPENHHSRLGKLRKSPNIQAGLSKDS